MLAEAPFKVREIFTIGKSTSGSLQTGNLNTLIAPNRSMKDKYIHAKTGFLIEVFYNIWVDLGIFVGYRFLDDTAGKIMNQKRSFLVVCLLAVSILYSCVYTEVRIPGYAANVTAYTLTSDDYQILGTVDTQGEFVAWFYVYLKGETGYSELLTKSKALGGDDIMNYRFETESKSILLFIYNRVKWNASALAIKYRDKIKK